MDEIGNAVLSVSCRSAKKTDSCIDHSIMSPPPPSWPERHPFSWSLAVHPRREALNGGRVSSYWVEERIVQGDTVWVAIRARGAEWSWLTPAEAARVGRHWIERSATVTAPA